ncbi:MAG: type II toxin-antitoxin system PemK/MazF family toxin [Candidatus Portnoybacteria bacterium]|nr:type II toxin-antitoxin system PemK/MazF family toxin [Candidatus Portnoybacteria bacterium]
MFLPGEAIFCFISSQLFSKDEVDIEVRPSKQNGLKMPSIIKIGKVATLSNRYEKRVKGRIGQLEHRYVSRVKCNLKNLFHLSTSYAVERSSRKNRGVKRGVFKDTPSEHRRF